MEFMSIYNSLCYTGKVYEVIFVNNVDFDVHSEKKRDILLCSHITVGRIAQITATRLA